ncbi:MAG: HAD family hydrolase, partial [Alphaproteobacteria bacterium]
MAIGGVLFDKDGTLLDFHETWMPIYRAAALVVARGDETLVAKLLRTGGQDDAAGAVASGSLLASANTRQIAAAWDRLAPNHGLGDLSPVIDEIFLREGAVRAVAVPNLGAILKRLKARGLSLGIATSDSRGGTMATLQPFGVLEQFGFIAGYDCGFGAK